ncbi:hypothetical protein H6F98_16385 [Microcoleus sp. FACHB-SPT15]|uniref:hypothetical protein n=1 Tax=Microcoleus sp. FACHB-SPT15 TaxID=2692830 RepID=UPI0017874B7C|nr:hypothetical protein [Microcoleus sp. FACHB-SPT15]MBD1807017.1 hypothetical protein [Microcoleus sp. FACHB-SPT15]
MKYIALPLFLMLSLAVVLPAQASFCRNSNDHLICILSIKRSAKNYWEYRAAVSVDGVKRPIEVYNCQERVRVRQDGVVVPFEPNSPGELICNLIKR